MSTVGMLLRRFPEKGVVQVPPTANITEAVGTMKKLNISSLLIIDDEDRFVGILSERDISWKIVLEGKDPQKTKVGEIMTPRERIITVTPNTTFKECLDMMRDQNVRHLPVLEKGELVGIISIKDIALSYDLLVADLERYITSGR